MKLTKEDIEKYGTEDEKIFLKESNWQHPEDEFLGKSISNEAKQAFESKEVRNEFVKWCDNNDQENTFHRGFLIGFEKGWEGGNNFAFPNKELSMWD